MSIAVKRTLLWAATAAWASVIFAMSSIPGSNVPGRFGPLAHFVEYTILATLIFWALRADLRLTHAALLAVAIASAYAISDEFHQSFVPMRTPDPVDWVVDTAGAVLGVSASYLIARRMTRERV